LVLRPGEEESFPVEVLAPCPVRAAVEAPGLTVYLAPNLAQGSAYLRVRAHLGTPPGNYRVPLPGGGGPFHLEGSGAEPYRLLAFQNWDGDGLLDPEEP
jgi:serine protease